MAAQTIGLLFCVFWDQQYPVTVYVAINNCTTKFPAGDCMAINDFWNTRRLSNYVKYIVLCYIHCFCKIKSVYLQNSKLCGSLLFVCTGVNYAIMTLS